MAWIILPHRSTSGSKGNQRPSHLIGAGGSENGGRYLKLADRPAVYLIEAKDSADLLKNAPELRDLKLLAFKARDISKIEISQPDTTMVLEDGDTWSGAAAIQSRGA
jgi:hypothetical protein